MAGASLAFHAQIISDPHPATVSKPNLNLSSEATFKNNKSVAPLPPPSMKAAISELSQWSFQSPGHSGCKCKITRGKYKGEQKAAFADSPEALCRLLRKQAAQLNGTCGLL